MVLSKQTKSSFTCSPWSESMCVSGLEKSSEEEYRQGLRLQRVCVVDSGHAAPLTPPAVRVTQRRIPADFYLAEHSHRVFCS